MNNSNCTKHFYSTFPEYSVLCLYLVIGSDMKRYVVFIYRIRHVPFQSRKRRMPTFTKHRSIGPQSIPLFIGRNKPMLKDIWFIYYKYTRDAKNSRPRHEYNNEATM